MSTQALQWKAEFDRLKGQVETTKGRADSVTPGRALPDQIAKAGLDPFPYTQVGPSRQRDMEPEAAEILR